MGARRRATAARQRTSSNHIYRALTIPNTASSKPKTVSWILRVYGDLLPMQVAQRLRAPCAIARMAYLASRLAISPDHFDLVFCDLVSHAIPVLRMLTRTRIIFYCHFPDQLLTPPRSGWYQWYRAPIDRLEEVTVGMAHRVLVNSEFTAAVFGKTFTRLREMCPKSSIRASILSVVAA